MIYLPEHPKAHHGFVLEHRWVMEQRIGRYLTHHEHVHHINGNKTDNRIENLRLLTDAQHAYLEHHIDKTDWYCGVCGGKTLLRKNGQEYWFNIPKLHTCNKCYLKDYHRRRKMSADISKV